jgi:hypothetical protein
MRIGRAQGWRIGGVGILVLLVCLLVARTTLVGNVQPVATATTGGDTADQQDQIPPPTPTTQPTLVPTATTVPTPRPTATPRPTPPPPPTGVPYPPVTTGKVILVSLSRQQLWTYNNGVYAFTNLVETGRPELPTPTGTFRVFIKKCSDLLWAANSAPVAPATHNVACAEHNGDGFQETFISPFPQGSPYWYYPTHINYALEFKSGGFYLHDAWWHVKFGPGSNTPHQLPNGTWETGSHGCVGMTTADAERLYSWAPNGATVVVRAVA